jgi:two-component system, chemotaxis family, CheB/CheR fusion protein
MSSTPDAAFDALLQFLKRTRGFDFTGYKRASLERRFRRRMETVGCTSFGDYLDYLEVHPEEYEELFDALLINVTDFFRDPPAWQQIPEEALPLILDGKPTDEPLRVWSAGCATGQEAYTIAMVLCEALGEDTYRRRAKIYATDVDEDALNVARQGSYSAREVENVPPELRERYFERSGDRFAFRTDLRRTLIFGRNNLVQDAPISRLDLLVCRNTLMYLNAETQAHVLRHFNFALRESGVLMLGKSEMMVSHRDLFMALDLKRRVFRRLPRSPSLQARVASMVNGERGEHPMTDDDGQALDAALELSAQAQLVVSRTGVLSYANVAARALLGIPAEHVGRPLAELRIAHEPVELPGPIEQALIDRRPIPLGEIDFKPSKGDERRLAVTVSPLLSPTNVALGAAVAYEDVSRYRVLQRELEENRRDLEAAYEELQSTIDELETTNEELQSANEELQTTNEELQSTNEELETMNEELHSTNQELETINDELRERTGELNNVNDFLEAILTSLGVAVAVVDRSQRVQVWNRGAEDLWGLRQDEASEQHFLALDIGLGPERLAPALRAVISGASPKETAQFEAVNRRGRGVVLDTTVMPLLSHGADGPEVRGAIVLMEDHPAARDGKDGDGKR